MYVYSREFQNVFAKRGKWVCNNKADSMTLHTTCNIFTLYRLVLHQVLGYITDTGIEIRKYSMYLHHLTI